MTNIAVIPARYGSKRIKNKNIKDFCGKPIIGWSIESALNAGCFDKVVVSTDEQSIADVALSFGAEVPFLRGPELADDHTPTISVIKDAILRLGLDNDKTACVCCIYATAPFLKSKTILGALSKLQDSGNNFVFTATKFPYPVQRALTVSDEGTVNFLDPSCESVRSQDLPQAYHDAGQLYWGRQQSWLSGESIISNKSAIFEIPRHLAQDIDDLEDWKFAEKLFRIQNYDLPGDM